MKKIFQIALYSALALQFVPVWASSVNVSASLSTDTLSAGQAAIMTIRFDIPDPWHIYALSDSGKDGTETKLALSLPEGFSSRLEKSQSPIKFKFFGSECDGYKNSAVFSYLIRAPKKISADSSGAIKVSAEWLACSDTCVPGSKEMSIPIKLAKSEIAEIGKTPGGYLINLLLSLAGAFIGGMVLNLMPCVFPVLALKAMSFAQSAGESYKKRLIGALAYSLGVLFSFIALAWILIGLRSAGQSFGWGFQLQNPTFVALMALLFFAMALSFAGAYEIGSGLSALGISDEKKARNKYLSSALSGVFAVLVASPCTAPFMGSAIGAALTSDASPMEISLIFASLGLGMATPYLLLAAVPRFASFMPRPGQWMEVLKNILSIPLFASAIWLAWVFDKQTGQISTLLASSLIMAVGLRIYGIYSAPHYSKFLRIGAVSAALILSATALCFVSPAEALKPAEVKKIPENAWSPEKLSAMLSKGESVYVDFTAAWCLTCQFNKSILGSESIRKLFEKKNIKMLVGDWTDKNPEILEQLQKFGRAGVPLNLLYSPKSPDSPIVLPSILTKSAVIEAVDKLPQ